MSIRDQVTVHNSLREEFFLTRDGNKSRQAKEQEMSLCSGGPVGVSLLGPRGWSGELRSILAGTEAWIVPGRCKTGSRRGMGMVMEACSAWAVARQLWGGWRLELWGRAVREATAPPPSPFPPDPPQ